MALLPISGGASTSETTSAENESDSESVVSHIFEGVGDSEREEETGGSKRTRKNVSGRLKAYCSERDANLGKIQKAEGKLGRKWDQDQIDKMNAAGHPETAPNGDSSKRDELARKEQKKYEACENPKCQTAMAHESGDEGDRPHPIDVDGEARRKVKTSRKSSRGRSEFRRNKRMTRKYGTRSPPSYR